MRVVVGRSTDEREAGQRDDGVDRGAAIGDEELVDRRPRIETRCKCRNDLQPAPLEGGDDAVVVRAVAGENVGAHDQQADATAQRSRRDRQV
jgi:hypothetical protein